MKERAAAICAGLAAWCTLGTIGLMGTASSSSRVALLPPWWLVPLLIIAFAAAIQWLRLSSAEISPLFGSSVVLLPWLPFPVPAAALIWTGPFAVGLWVVVIAGIVQARTRSRSTTWLTDSRRGPIAAATIALALYGVSASWLAPMLPEGDAPHYLILAQSLIIDGDLKIENNHRRGDYLGYSLTAAAPDFLRRGVNGEIYSIHAPGLPVLIAPAMWLLGYPGVVAFLGIVAALSTALVWHLAYRITGSAPAAWFGWASCALTTPFVFQATEVFPDGIAATFVLLGALPLLTGRADEGVPRDRDVGGKSGSALWLLSGISLAILPWLQTRLSILAVAVGCCLFLRIRSSRQWVSFAALPVASAALWFGFFYVVYGTFNPAAPYGSLTQTTIGNLFRGLPALLFDQQFGLIPNAPVYGFVLAGLLVGVATLRRWSGEVLAIVVPYMAAVGMYQMWWGGTSVPARLLTPIALLLAVAAARIWHDSSIRATRLAGLAALAVSVLITFALLVPDRGRLLLNFRDGVSLWLEWANDLLDLPKALPSFFRDDPLRARLKIVIWIACMLGGWLALRLIDRQPRDRWRKNVTALLSGTSIWTMAVTVMIAFTLAWRVEGAQPRTPDTSAIGLVRHASPLRPIGFDFDTWRFETPRVLLSAVRIRSDRQRRPLGPTTLLSARDVPAGSYDLHVISSGTAPEGTLVIRVGNASLPLFSASSADLQSRAEVFPIRLPVGVRSVLVEGDDAAVRSVAAVELGFVAEGVESVLSGVTGQAHRAVRYTFDEFFMDDNAYPEPTGFWVAGGRAARVVIGAAEGGGELVVRNSGVANTVTIDLDGHPQEMRLAPGEERVVTLPKPRRGSDLFVRIKSQNGFRPSEVEPGNADLRYLGCWVEIR